MRKLALVFARRFPIAVAMGFVFSMHAASAATPAAAVPVTAKTVQDLAVYPEASISASVVSLNDSKLSAEVRAVIDSIPVMAGDQVEKGAVLVKLDSLDYRLAMDRAEAGLRGLDARIELAQYQLERAKILSKQNIGTEENVKQRDSELKSLVADKQIQQAVLQSAIRDLKKCVVVAPFAGIVRERLASVGELASPGTPLIHIVDVENVELVAKVQPQDIGTVDNRQKFQFNAQGHSFSVQLRRVAALLDPVERSREARLVFVGDRALVGSAGTLVWRESAPYLPADVLVRRSGKLGVFLLKENTAQFEPIAGAQEGRPVLSQLRSDARVIVDGRFLLQHGDPVKLK